MGLYRENPIKKRLAAAKKSLGLWLVADDPFAAEIAGGAGFDFVIIDHEHGLGDIKGLARLLMALAAGGGAARPSSFVRVPSLDVPYIKRVLDAGAEGIMVPMVTNAEEAALAVAATRYPTDGIRGCAVGANHATNFGAQVTEYWAGINQQVAVMLQIESPQAADNIPEIAAVPGVDALFIGPNDLLVSAGYDPFNPTKEALALLARAEQAVLDSGVPLASIAFGGQSPDALFDKGYAMIAAGSEMSVLRRALQAQTAPHREKHG